MRLLLAAATLLHVASAHPCDNEAMKACPFDGGKALKEQRARSMPELPLPPVFANLDKPQTLLRMSIEHAMHQGGLTRTSGTPEQSVIRRQTRQQLPGILNQ